jgi:arginyl-tRNA synthetase
MTIFYALRRIPQALSISKRSHNFNVKSFSNLRLTTVNEMTQVVRRSLEMSFGSEIASQVDAFVVHSGNKKNKIDYDYQCNVAMPLAKITGLNPKDVASLLVTNLELNDIVSNVNVAGPGFINMTLSDAYLSKKLYTIFNDKSGRLGISVTKQKQRIIVDFSSPNIAKEMHVGHLRSTILGESISKLLEFLGHDVHRVNHVGDWGTQFGMLIHFMKQENKLINKTGEYKNISDLASFYRNAKLNFDECDNFKMNSREQVVKLQNGDIECLNIWADICESSRNEFQNVYDTLQIKELVERGESFYNPMLDNLIEFLDQKGLLVESDGAMCIFLPGYTNQDGDPQPMILKKSDGGFLYATTDLAAVRHRVEVEKADRILYVTDNGQAQHFNMLFDASKIAGLIPNTELRHVPFGVVQGEDGKKFKTRSGEIIKLKDLLGEAVAKARDDILSRSTAANEIDLNVSVDTDNYELSAENIHAAQVIGIGAVKYADLCMNRESNYRFSFDKMLNLHGNTAPFMLYSYARVKGIERKAAAAGYNTAIANGDVKFDTAEEIALAKHLIRFEEILSGMEKDLYPSKLCDYLFELSQKFNNFYENCPVIQADDEKLRKCRSGLCSLTADTLRLGLGLLGIEVLEKL